MKVGCRLRRKLPGKREEKKEERKEKRTKSDELRLSGKLKRI
jgi:hypothetical protein